MGTIADKLQYTADAKDSIRSAIVDKGVDCPGTAPLGDYDDYIEQISGGGGGTLVDLNVTSNGTYLPSAYSADGFRKVIAAVPGASDIKILDYIGSTGGPSIDFGIPCKSTLRIQLGLNMQEAVGGAILGTVITEADAFRFFNYNNTAYLDFGSGSGYNRIYGGSIYQNIMYELEIGNRYVKNLVSGSNLTSGSTVSAFTKSYNLTLTGNKGRYYYVRIYDSDELILDAYPAMDKDDKVGLYDVVNKKFLYNRSSTPFTYGRVVGYFSEGGSGTTLTDLIITSNGTYKPADY